MNVTIMKETGAKQGPTATGLSRAAVLAEGPAVVPKADVAKAVRNIILRIERSQRNSLFREDGPEFTEKLCKRILQLEALALSSPATSEEGGLAIDALRLICDPRGEAPEAMRLQAAGILRQLPGGAPPVTAL